MRVFIGIPLPEETKRYLNGIEDEFKECDCLIKWVQHTNLHITLKFLGEIKEERLPLINGAIEETSKNFSKIFVSLRNFGFFPHEKNPRVFFVSVDKDEILRRLAYALEKRLEPMGFTPEHRFKSHITLGRIKSKKNIECLIRKTKRVKLINSFYIDSIILYKSTLTPKGPIYESIFKNPLT